ncbi:hypothetical protein C8R44DRAFT_745098 [Mycena epipterygia]|nr:hypothetical protein C8R44DRAFT_745098 [Mycena epipterygia]
MATVVLESLLYGFLLVLFSTNLYLRITRYAKPRESVSCGGLWWNHIAISNMAIFVTCTVHWIITVERLFLAFLGSARDPLQFYLRLTLVVNNSLVIAAVLIGDAVIIHRLWIIWNRDLRVVFVPVLSWLGILTCGIAIIYIFTQFIATNNNISTADGAWVTANWALDTLCVRPSLIKWSNLNYLHRSTNIYCTTFIAWRIWKTSRAEAEVGGGLLMKAPPYGRSTLQLILSDLTPSIVGLVNLLIHLRVGLGWSRAEAPDATSAPMTSTASMFVVNLQTENDEYCLESISPTGLTSSRSCSQATSERMVDYSGRQELLTLFLVPNYPTICDWVVGHLASSEAGPPEMFEFGV